MNYCFLEFSYDPQAVTVDQVHGDLAQLGFMLRRKQVDGDASLWSVNNAVILVTPRPGTNITGSFTGVAFNGQGSNFDELGVDTCDVINLDYVEDPHGVRFYLFDDIEHIRNYVDDHYQAVELDMGDVMGIQQITGLVLPGFSTARDHFVRYFGLRQAKHDDRFMAFRDGSSTFSLIFDSQDTNTAIIADCRDVFEATSVFIHTGVDLREYPDGVGQQDFGYDLNVKIMKFGSIASGNAARYTIENVVQNALPNEIRLVFRTKKDRIGTDFELLAQHLSDAT